MSDDQRRIPIYRWGAMLLLMVVACAGAAADEFASWVETLYRPCNAELVALSPDGRHLAYSTLDQSGTAVVVIDLTDPTKKIRVPVPAAPKTSSTGNRWDSRLRFLAWSSSDRLVFAPPLYSGIDGAVGPIYAMNADGSDATQIAGSEDFNDPLIRGRINPQTRIIGLIPQTPSLLLIEVPALLREQGRPLAIGASSPGGRTLDMPSTDADRPIGKVPQVQAETEVYSVDVNRAKARRESSEFPSGVFAYDQQGHIALVEHRSPHSDTRTYQYFAPKRRAWVDFDAATLHVPREALSLSPENFYGEHAYPLGCAFDPNVVYFASNVGRDTFAIESLDLRSKECKIVAEDPALDLAPNVADFTRPTLVFDARTKELVGLRRRDGTTLRWLDPEVRGWHDTLTRKFVGGTVDIVQWDEARNTVLFRVTTATNPGSYWLFDPHARKTTEVLRMAPWLPKEQMNSGEPFEFVTEAGVRLRGYVTYPRQPRINPPPVALYFASQETDAQFGPFDRTAQVLAEMGIVVLRVNCRGTQGYGRAFRNAVLESIDRVPIDDCIAALAWMAKQHKIDRSRVVAYGVGLGGYVALRALQLKPDIFRCAVTDNALDLGWWINPPIADEHRFDPAFVNLTQETRKRYFARQGGQSAEQRSVLADPEAITKPVFLRASSNAPEGMNMIFTWNRQLASVLKRRHAIYEYRESDGDFAMEVPAARAVAYQQLLEFLNVNLYDFNVHVGRPEVVK